MSDASSGQRTFALGSWSKKDFCRVDIRACGRALVRTTRRDATRLAAAKLELQGCEDPLCLRRLHAGGGPRDIGVSWLDRLDSRLNWTCVRRGSRPDGWNFSDLGSAMKTTTTSIRHHDQYPSDRIGRRECVSDFNSIDYRARTAQTPGERALTIWAHPTLPRFRLAHQHTSRSLLLLPPSSSHSPLSS